MDAEMLDDSALVWCMTLFCMEAVYWPSSGINQTTAIETRETVTLAISLGPVSTVWKLLLKFLSLSL